MDQDFSPPMGQDARSRTTGNLNSRIYQSTHITSPNLSHPDYQQPSMSTINPSLEYQGLSGTGTTSGHPGGRTSLPARPSPVNDSLHHQEPADRYGDDVMHSVEYPGLSAPNPPNGFHETSMKQPKQLLPVHSPQDRHLPPREVTDQTLDDTYLAFILYCNPTVPKDTESTELRKVFRTPPKSDGKSFSTFRLFELIRKLEDKEIRTWTQLAIQLGVEPPSTEKNQSAQKVQQYAVRLKVSPSSA